MIFIIYIYTSKQVFVRFVNKLVLSVPPPSLSLSLSPLSPSPSLSLSLCLSLSLSLVAILHRPKRHVARKVRGITGSLQTCAFGTGFRVLNLPGRPFYSHTIGVYVARKKSKVGSCAPCREKRRRAMEGDRHLFHNNFCIFLIGWEHVNLSKKTWSWECKDWNWKGFSLKRFSFELVESELLCKVWNWSHVKLVIFNQWSCYKQSTWLVTKIEKNIIEKLLMISCAILE